MTFQKCNVNLKLHQSEFKVSVLILGLWLLDTLHSEFLKGCSCLSKPIRLRMFFSASGGNPFSLSSWKRRGSKHTVSVTSSWLLEKRSTILVCRKLVNHSTKHFHPVAIHWIINSFIPLEFTRHSSLS